MCSLWVATRTHARITWAADSSLVRQPLQWTVCGSDGEFVPHEGRFMTVFVFAKPMLRSY